MSIETLVARHYTTGNLFERITAALATLGVTVENASPDDLKAVDEFHVGGVAATRELIATLAIEPDMQVLDIGSGLGGTARFVADRTGAKVTGLDLTPEFVETATALSQMVGLGSLTRFSTGSALAMPFAPASFDVALMIHVGMNIKDKTGLMGEIARVLKPGAVLAVYDIMQTGEAGIDFPIPWAESAESSFLAPLQDYRAAARAAGFAEVAHRDCRDAALQFFAEQRARLEAHGPPALGIHLLMGNTRAEKLKNMVKNIDAGRIAPVELVLRRDDGGAAGSS